MDGCGIKAICYNRSEWEDKHTVHGREERSVPGVYMGYTA